jgi:hypothetical protein
MPKLKAHPPASRKSTRLAPDQKDRPTLQPTDCAVNDQRSNRESPSTAELNDKPATDPDISSTKPTDEPTPDNDPVNDDGNYDRPLLSIEIEVLEDFQSANESRTASPEPTPDATPQETPAEMAEQNNNNELARLRARIRELETEQQLQRQLSEQPDQQEPRNNREPSIHRDVRPEESAYGGSKFAPIGIAARRAFKPYGSDQYAKNPAFERKARPTGRDPGEFDGTRNQFDHWIQKVADKFIEDDDTFKMEKSRMALVYNLATKEANGVIASRYQSETRPYSCVAEMIQALAAVYHSPTQSADARRELNKMMWDPKIYPDIHVFIAKIGELCDKCNIIDSERKSTLYDHIPKNLDARLLRETVDPHVSYETFAANVASAATNHMHDIADRQARRARNSSPRNNHRNRYDQGSPRRSNRKPNKPKMSRVRAGKDLTYEEKKAHWDAGTCYNCGDPGHKSQDCTDTIPQVKAAGRVRQQAKEKDFADDETVTDDSGKEEDR